MKHADTIKNLTEQRDKFKSSVDDLQTQLNAALNRLEAAESMLRVATGQPEPTKAPRTNVKQFILDLLSTSGSVGVNSLSVLEAAAKRGERLERNTVSSLLSRFKAEGLVEFHGKMYRLKGASTAASTEAPAMH